LAFSASMFFHNLLSGGAGSQSILGSVAIASNGSRPIVELLIDSALYHIAYYFSQDKGPVVGVTISLPVSQIIVSSKDLAGASKSWSGPILW
jgi:hypothetical protein